MHSLVSTTKQPRNLTDWDMVSVRGHPDVYHRSVMQYNAVQGLVEIKDKHSPWEGPMLLGRDLP